MVCTKYSVTVELGFSSFCLYIGILWFSLLHNWTVVTSLISPSHVQVSEEVARYFPIKKEFFKKKLLFKVWLTTI